MELNLYYGNYFVKVIRYLVIYYLKGFALFCMFLGKNNETVVSFIVELIDLLYHFVLSGLLNYIFIHSSLKF